MKKRIQSQRSPRAVSPARRPAFTLVEVLVVIAIMILLTGLLLAGGAAMRRAAKRHAAVTSFEQLKNAFMLYRSELGYPVNEAEAAGWMVSEGGGTKRPLTTMEYFMFKMNGVAQASRPLYIIDANLRVPSTTKAAGGWYNKVDIFIPDPATGALPATPSYTLYDPNAPAGDPNAAPVGWVFDKLNTAPLYTVIGPWDPSAWNPADWSHSSTWTYTYTDGSGSHTITPTCKWRPYELDFRRLTDAADTTLQAAGGVPPFLPYCESALFSSPGPDGLWGCLSTHQIGAADPAQDPNGNSKDNLYSNQREE